MTAEDRSAAALAAWLENPTASPPADLDPSVLEAVIALRPDLAPPARVTLEEILADLPRVPDRRPEGTVVPLFGRAARWVGGIGGVGVLLAAAATVLVVGIPLLESAKAPLATPVAPPPSAAPEMRKTAQNSPVVTGEIQDGVAAPVGAAEVTSRAAAAPQTSAPGKGDSRDDKLAPADLGDPQPFGADIETAAAPPPPPPMLAPTLPDMDNSGLEKNAMDNTGGYNTRLASGPSVISGEGAGLPAAELEEAKEPAAKSSRAKGKDEDSSLDLFRAAAQPAEALNDDAVPAAVSQTASPEQQAPTPLDAGRALLEAGDAKGALDAAERGLREERDNTPYRSELLVLKGDALRALDEESAAISAWEEAARLNAQRR